MEEKRLTILVNSCDKNEDLWEVFFTILKKKWPDCPYRIIFNTETKAYSFDGFNIECFCVCKDKTEEELKGYEWTDRLIDNLNYIDTKYTMFLLEDFYLENEVKNSDVEDLLDRMDGIKKLAGVYLLDNKSQYPNYYDKKVKLFKRHKYSHPPCKISAIACIWNTEYLKKITKRGETPWDFEFKTSRRCRHTNMKFYTTDSSNPPHDIKKPFKFSFSNQLIQGKWSTVAKDFLTKEGLEIDFEKRGVVEFYEDYSIYRNDRVKKHQGASKFLYTLNVFYSFIVRERVANHKIKKAKREKERAEKLKNKQ